VRHLIVLLAHGSPDPRAAVATHDVARLLAERLPKHAVRAAFLDRDWPTLTAAIGRELDRGHVEDVVVVPMFLNNAHHARSDVPDAVATARRDHATPISITPPIGAEPRLLDAIDAQLPARRPAVLATAGTSDVAAQRDLVALAELWEQRRQTPVVVSYASLAEPDTDVAIADLRLRTGIEPVIGTFLLFPGLLTDRVVEQSDGLPMSQPLSASSELLEVLIARISGATTV
jgi:sirohydrochlorin ferrochelatase